MKKPFLHALAAALYIVFIVLTINTFSSFLPEETIIIPMVMLSLLVLSVAVMAFIFFFEPFQLYTENKKQEAVTFFGKTLGFFACFLAVFLILLFLL